MSDEFTLTLNSPITEEQWDMITDVDLDNTNEITFHTKHGKEVKFVKASAQSEIIVCADCKHWICHDKRCGYWNHDVKPLDWCCHAERRTG